MSKNKPRVFVNLNRAFSPGTKYRDLLAKSFDEVVLAFQERIQKWYLDQALLASPQHEGFLQTTMACIILDIVCQYYFNLPKSSGKKFQEFLREKIGEFCNPITPPIISCSFDDKKTEWKEIELKTLDQAFWHGYRCGIIHNGMILEYGRISGSFGEQVVQLREREDGKGQEVVVNPGILIRRVDEIFKIYIQQLLDEDGSNQTLRKNFAEKFERDFGITIKPSRLSLKNPATSSSLS